MTEKSQEQGSGPPSPRGPNSPMNTEQPKNEEPVTQKQFLRWVAIVSGTAGVMFAADARLISHLSALEERMDRRTASMEARMGSIETNAAAATRSIEDRLDKISADISTVKVGITRLEEARKHDSDLLSELRADFKKFGASKK